MNRLSSYILALLCVIACAKEQPVPGEGTLSFTLVDASSVTKSNPSELGAPVATDFDLLIHNSLGEKVYDGKFPGKSFSCPPDTYSIKASYGQNPLIGLESPYYVGQTEATVSANETTTATIPCKLGNALVSVSFGADETETARFKRYYSSYSLCVEIVEGPESFDAFITDDAPEKSVYVRAGEKVRLSFSATRSSDGGKVSMEIPLPSGVSATLQAADHIQVKLSLAPAEDSAIINAETQIVTATISQTISYEYLPAPTVIAAHKYDKGELIGTDVALSASFGTWGARIRNSAGVEVRSVSGHGDLFSYASNSDAWPFLPAGTYTASFFITNEDGTVYELNKTRTFSVKAPTLSISMGGYSSYTKYTEGDVDAANGCERLTVYALSARLNVSQKILANENYSCDYSCAFRESSQVADKGQSLLLLPEQTGVPVSANTYPFTASATFCGQTVTGQKGFRITGLPVKFAPPKSLDTDSDNGWSKSGDVTFEDSDVRLGKMSLGGQDIVNDRSVNIPSGVNVALDYDVVVHAATAGTTLTIYMGGQKLFEHEQGGKAFQSKDFPFVGKATATTSSVTTQLKCHNSYGAGQTHSRVNSLYFYYGK